MFLRTALLHRSTHTALILLTCFLLAYAFCSTQLAKAEIITVGSVADESALVGNVENQTVIFDIFRGTLAPPSNAKEAVFFKNNFAPQLRSRCPVYRDFLSPSKRITPAPKRLDNPPGLTNPNGSEKRVTNCTRVHPASWLLISWQVRAGNTGGNVQLKLLSESDPQVVIFSQEKLEQAEPNTVNTFPINRQLSGEELEKLDGFAVAVVGKGPAPYVVPTGVPTNDLKPGIADVAGNPQPGTFVDIGTIQQQKQRNFAVTLESDIDHDAIGDSSDDDVDGDGILNLADNCRWENNPDQADLNKNGVGTLCDNVEPWEHWRDQLLASDQDHDQISFKDEMTIKTDVCDSDSDDDGLTDGNEYRKTRTSPIKFDSDRDKLSDGLEVGLRKNTVQRAGNSFSQLSCYDSRPGKDTNRNLFGTKISQFRYDHDPKTTTNPRKRDTDHDGINDGREDRNHNGRIDRGECDPRKRRR